MKQIQLMIPEGKEEGVISLLEDKMHIRNITRVHTETNTTIIFQTQNSNVKKIMEQLEEQGIGMEYGLVNVLPIELSRPFGSEEAQKDIGLTITVEELYCKTAAGSVLNLDFLLMMTVAGVVAAVGLASNNSVSVVAAMLLSPMVGPILGMSLGGIIRDKKLFMMSFITEIVALIICILIGSFFGLVMGAFGSHYQWPTEEMLSRGEWSGLILSAIIGIASGVGVGVAVTRGETVGLVGVGIAASLLPPAVNTGINFTFAFFSYFSSYPISLRRQMIIAGISLALTLLNISLIFIFSMITFKFKSRIQPLRKRSETWRELPRLSTAVRAELYNRTIDMEGVTVHEQIQNTIKNIRPRTIALKVNPFPHIHQIFQQQQQQQPTSPKSSGGALQHPPTGASTAAPGGVPSTSNAAPQPFEFPSSPTPNDPHAVDQDQDVVQQDQDQDEQAPNHGGGGGTRRSNKFISRHTAVRFGRTPLQQQQQQHRHHHHHHDTKPQKQHLLTGPDMASSHLALDINDDDDDVVLHQQPTAHPSKWSRSPPTPPPPPQAPDATTNTATATATATATDFYRDFGSSSIQMSPRDQEIYDMQMQQLSPGGGGDKKKKSPAKRQQQQQQQQQQNAHDNALSDAAVVDSRGNASRGSSGGGGDSGGSFYSSAEDITSSMAFLPAATATTTTATATTAAVSAAAPASYDFSSWPMNTSFSMDSFDLLAHHHHHQREQQQQQQQQCPLDFQLDDPPTATATATGQNNGGGGGGADGGGGVASTNLGTAGTVPATFPSAPSSGL